MSPHLKAPPSPETPASTTEITVVEPPSLRGIAEVDSALLDEAVAVINRMYVHKGLEMYFAVGEYLLSTFFGGDPDIFHTRGKGHATFRALGEREDLRLGASALYNAVAVVEQRHLLPDDLASSLSFEHQVKLLPVKDENEKVGLARKAVEEDLSSRALAAEVKRLKEAQRDGVRLGRPNLPNFVKAFGRLRSIREFAAAEPIGPETFANYSPEKTRLLLSDVEHWMRGLQETVEQVRGALEEFSARGGKKDDVVEAFPGDGDSC